MRIRHIAWKELWHRKLGALLILLGIVLCVALVVAIQRYSLASINEMRKVTLSMGKNLVILPGDASLDDYLADKFRDEADALPESDVRAVADYCITGKVTARHFLGSFQKKAKINGEPLVVSGIMVEIDPAAPAIVVKDAQQKLATDQVALGHHAAKRLGAEPGGRLDVTKGPLAGKTFEVQEVKPETGTVDDFKVFVNIDVAREAFGVKTKVVNVIEAVNCVCVGTNLKKLSKDIQNGLFKIDDNTYRAQVHHVYGIANARYQARKGLMGDVNWLSAAMGLFGVLLIGGYSVVNARERRREMGIVLAIALTPRHVAWLFLQKMLLLGLAGGVLGCVAGELLAQSLGAPILTALHPSMRAYVLGAVGWEVYAIAVGAAVVLTAIPSLIGVLVAATTDPADTLREL